MTAVAVTLFSVLLVVLTLASPVAAEDAWVLWAEQKRATRGGAYERTSLDPVSRYASLQECAAKLDSLQSAGDQRLGPSTLYRFTGDPKVAVFFVTFQCLPATVEPVHQRSGDRVSSQNRPARRQHPKRQWPSASLRDP